MSNIDLYQKIADKHFSRLKVSLSSPLFLKLRNSLKSIREESVNNMKQLLKEAEENLSKNGVQIHHAEDGKRAAEIFREIVEPGIIIKSKSNTFRELKLKERLPEYQFIESDCGDIIIDKMKASPSHFVTPAMHLPKDEILNFFNATDVKQLASELRSEIRSYASRAAAGVTGANAISADGYILLIENEGNISLTSTLPPTHIVVAGWDKLVSSLEKSLLVARAQSLWSTGTDPAYLHMISQPSGTVDIGDVKVRGMHGAREVHLILVDNGRSKLLESDLREILKCIGCGVCLYVCPVYRILLSEFGGELPGFRGLIHTYLSGDLQKLVDSGLFKCTGCNLCQEMCPVSISLKDIFWFLRSISFENGYLDEVGRDLIEKINRFGNAVGEVKRGERPTLHCC
ncbi:hypothetical protein B6U74_02785 [Candidatus Bathyarchaeota archaeon ex4484_205]|nr:MAG: hypothetical protein B6U74_02785 [Candidatus Bathyarchaeota archaeon ex4484_205]